MGNIQKELLNRNAWEEPKVEGVIEDNKTAKYSGSGVETGKGDVLKVTDSVKHS